MSDQKSSFGIPQAQGINEDPLLWVTKTFIVFLQKVFATFEKGNYRWEPDYELTDIVIGDQGQFGDDVLEKRPAIICMRKGAQWLNVSMDQFLSDDLATGARTHTDLIASTMIYNCIAREGLEAQRLAWIAAYATRVLKKSLMRAGFHRVGENVDIGEETDAGALLPDSGKEFVLVPVMVPCFFRNTYTVSPVDKLLLKELRLNVTSQATTTPGLRPPAIKGRDLQVEKVISLTQRVSTKGEALKKSERSS